MSGNCVCRFLCRDGGCLAEDGYLCPMEHDVEGLVKDIEGIAVRWLKNKLGSEMAIASVGDLVQEYLKRQRGG